MATRLNTLIHYLAKLPGVGNKTAKRYAIHLLKHKENVMLPLAEVIADAANFIYKCQICGNYDDKNVCYICRDETRDTNILCIVETITDLWSLEESKVFNGKYHVLGGNLSASSEQDPEQLNIPNISLRVEQDNIQEVVIATNTNIDGQTTAFYITEQLKPLNIKITRLASGIPIGGELTYLDEGTITAAFNARKNFL